MRELLLVIVLLAAAPFPATAEAAEKPAPQILVFGGTGRLGSDIVKALVEDGHSVTVFVRPTSDRRRLAGLPIAWVVGDVLDAKTVEAAFAGKDYQVAIDALGRGSEGVDFYSMSAENIAASAASHGVQQILLHGSVGAGESSDALADHRFFNRMQGLMNAKTEGENAVVECGVSYTIIRNGRLMPYGTPATGRAELYEDQMLIGSVTREGLARLTAGCILNEECFNKIYHAVDKSLGDEHVDEE